MAEEPKTAASKNAPTLLKTLGGVAFLVASVGVFVHRIPRTSYVEVHADKPRPTAARPAPAVAAAKPKPAPPVKPGLPGKPAQAVVASAAAGEGALSADPVEDWRDACSAEIGILCNNVAERRVPRCLHQYDDVLRKDCSKVLSANPGLARADL